MVREKTIRTSEATLAVSESAGRGLPLLLLHGNGSSKTVFRDLMSGPLGRSYRLVALDLPGHGASSRPRHPRTAYSLPGLAATVIEALAALGIDEAAIFGWSVGGHVALEMLPKWPGALGALVMGAPPAEAGVAGIQRAFRPDPRFALAASPRLDAAEAEVLLGLFFGDDVPAYARADLERADGQAREFLFAGIFAGEAADERAIVERSRVPVAIVNGTADPLVNPDYLAELATGSLWEDRCHWLPGLGHAAFLQDPTAFNPVLLRFMRTMSRRRTLIRARTRSGEMETMPTLRRAAEVA